MQLESKLVEELNNLASGSYIKTLFKVLVARSHVFIPNDDSKEPLQGALYYAFPHHTFPTVQGQNSVVPDGGGTEVHFV